MDETLGMARYRALVAVWMAAREAAGASWTQADEARYAGDVDHVWVTLSEDEQEASISRLSSAALPRPPHP
jgi:hypothetical protein